MSLKKKGVESVKWTLIENLIVQGFAFVTTILLTRILLPEDFGLIGVIMVFLTISKAIIDSGLGTSLIKDNDADDHDFSTVFFANIGVSIVLYLILFISAPSIAVFFEDNRLTQLLRVLSFGLILSAASSIQTKILIKNLNFKKLTILRLPGIFLGSIIAIYCAYSGLSYWSLVIKELVTLSLDALVLWTKAGWKPKWVFHKEKFKYHFNYGYKLMLTSILDSVFSEVYALVIGKFFSINTLGYYNRANRFMKLPRRLLINVVTKPTFPLISKIKEDKEKVGVLYRKMIRGLFFIVAPTFVILATISEPLFNLLLTDKWGDTIVYFQILCLGSILYPVLSFNHNIFKVYDRTDLTLKLALFKKLLVAIVVVVGVSLGSMQALLWGMVISTYLAFFINSWYSKKMINYSSWQQIKDLFPTLTSSIITGSTGYLIIETRLFELDILNLSISLVIMSTIYIALSIIIKNKGLLDFKTLVSPFLETRLKKFKK